MADDAPRALRCFVKGDSIPFKVSAAVNLEMDDLKDLIKEKCMKDVKDVDAKDLRLWKVRMRFSVIPSDITVNTTLACGGYLFQAF